MEGPTKQPKAEQNMAQKVKLEHGRVLNLENVVSAVQDQGVRLRFVLAVESVEGETLTLWK